MNPSRTQHWNDVYASKREDEVSWFQGTPGISLELIERCALPADAKIIDVGAGASRLVDALLDRRFSEVTVLDISASALEATRSRLGERREKVRWIVDDVTAFEPRALYDLWHDRAVFHFLTAPEERAAYVRTLVGAVAPGGHVIVGTFALDGPERCSGLEVVRYSARGLADALGSGFDLVESVRDEHATPAGRVQAFTFVRLRRK